MTRKAKKVDDAYDDAGAECRRSMFSFYCRRHIATYGDIGLKLQRIPIVIKGECRVLAAKNFHKQQLQLPFSRAGLKELMVEDARVTF